MSVSLRGKRTYVDASVVIYATEKLHEFPSLKLGFLDLLDAGELVVVTSELTVLETVAGARKKNDALLESEFRGLLTPSTSMVVRPIDAVVLERTIDLRLLGLKTPDAIHVATEIVEGCDVFLTHDKEWGRAGITIVKPADLA